jgi:hypothetical protein
MSSKDLSNAVSLPNIAAKITHIIQKIKKPTQQHLLQNLIIFLANRLQQHTQAQQLPGVEHLMPIFIVMCD